jgi:hypothetical protein
VAPTPVRRDRKHGDDAPAIARRPRKHCRFINARQGISRNCAEETPFYSHFAAMFGSVRHVKLGAFGSVLSLPRDARSHAALVAMQSSCLLAVCEDAHAARPTQEARSFLVCLHMSTR